MNAITTPLSVCGYGSGFNASAGRHGRLKGSWKYATIFLGVAFYTLAVEI